MLMSKPNLLACIAQSVHALSHYVIATISIVRTPPGSILEVFRRRKKAQLLTVLEPTYVAMV